MSNFEKIVSDGSKNIKKAARLGLLGVGISSAVLSAEAQNANQSQNITRQETSTNQNRELKKHFNSREKEEKMNAYSFGPVYDFVIEMCKKNNQANDSIEKEAMKTEVADPEEYNLRKIASPDFQFLHGLKEKKSLQEPAIINLMMEYLKRAQAFNEHDRLYSATYSTGLGLGDLLRRREYLQKTGCPLEGCEGDDENSLDRKISEKAASAVKFEEELIKNAQEREKIYNLEYSEIPLGNQYQKYLDQAPKIFSEIERARQEAKRLMSDDAYVKKLQSEFGCSLEEARHHQEVRLSNLDFINYDLLSSAEIDAIMRAADRSSVTAFYITQTNIIVLPFNLEDKLTESEKEQKGFFKVALHEFLHAATDAEKGISLKAKGLLSKESFEGIKDTGDEEADKSSNKYYSESTERYARFKSLEEDLSRLKIKSRGEEFTFKHFEKLMELFRSGKLSDDAQDFIIYTKGYHESNDSEIFKNLKNIFDNIAQVDYGKNQGAKFYKHSGWNYGDLSDRT